MSDATRDVKIRVKWEGQGGKLESPDISQYTQQLKSQEQELRNIAKAEREVISAYDESVRALKRQSAEWDKAAGARGRTLRQEIDLERSRVAKQLGVSRGSVTNDQILRSLEGTGDAPDRGSRGGIGRVIASNMRYALQEDKELESVRKSLKETSGAYEEFGRRSTAAYQSSLEGVSNLTRGLALLGTDGTADAHRLLEKVVAIQGAVDVMRGGMQLARLGPVVGGVTGTVLAGAAAWMAYSNQIEKSKKALKELDDIARAHREGEDRTRASQAENNRRSKTEITDAAILAETREKRRKEEESDIRKSLAETATMRSAYEAAAAKESAFGAAAKGREASYRDMASESFWKGSPLQSWRLTDRANREKEAAEKSAKNYEENLGNQLRGGEQEAADRRRLLGIEQSRYQDNVSAIERSRDAEQAILRGRLDAMRAADDAMSPTARAKREREDDQYNRKRGQFAGAIGGLPTFAGPGGDLINSALGMAATTTPQQIREGGLQYQGFAAGLNADKQITDVSQAFEKTFADMRDMIRRVDNANAELKRKLDSAHTN